MQTFELDRPKTWPCKMQKKRCKSDRETDIVLQNSEDLGDLNFFFIKIKI